MDLTSNITEPQGEPHDRLTRLCDAMGQALEAHPEYADDVQALIMLDSTDCGGFHALGFDNAAETIESLVRHLDALCKAHGIELVDVVMAPRGQIVPRGHG